MNTIQKNSSGDLIPPELLNNYKANKVYSNQDLITKAYVKDTLIKGKPDLVLYVDGTDPFYLWYNYWMDSQRNDHFEDVKRLDLYPDENGICEVYLPSDVYSLTYCFDPYSGSQSPDDEIAKELNSAENYRKHPYFFRLKKVYGLNKLLASGRLRQISGFAAEQNNVEYIGDFENWDISGLEITRQVFDSINAQYYPEYLDLTKWDVSNQETIEVICYNNNVTKTLDISTWDTRNCKSLDQFCRNTPLERLITGPNWNTSKVTNLDNAFRLSPNMLSLPTIDYRSSTRMHDSFDSKVIKKIEVLNTQNVKLMWRSFQCQSLEDLSPLDLSSCTMAVPFVNCNNLKYILLKNLGKSDFSKDSQYPVPENTIDLTGVPNWGSGSEYNRKSLIDSLITYSYDRVANNKHTYNMKLNKNVVNRLTEEEKAQITAKGYTIISV